MIALHNTKDLIVTCHGIPNVFMPRKHMAEVIINTEVSAKSASENIVC